MNKKISQSNMSNGIMINYITRLLLEDKLKFVEITRPDGVIEILFIPKEETDE